MRIRRLSDPSLLSRVLPLRPGTPTGSIEGRRPSGGRLRTYLGRTLLWYRVGSSSVVYLTRPEDSSCVPGTWALRTRTPEDLYLWGFYRCTGHGPGSGPTYSLVTPRSTYPT